MFNINRRGGGEQWEMAGSTGRHNYVDSGETRPSEMQVELLAKMRCSPGVRFVVEQHMHWTTCSLLGCPLHNGARVSLAALLLAECAVGPFLAAAAHVPRAAAVVPRDHMRTISVR
jgi:hypothetical protein